MESASAENIVQDAVPLNAWTTFWNRFFELIVCKEFLPQPSTKSQIQEFVR